MNQFEPNKTYSTAEYFLSEEGADLRHEFINGNLIGVPDDSRKHHFICQNILRTFETLFSNSYEIYMGSMKVKIQNENQYYYPDILITKEPETDENRFVQFQPELIVEVLSDTTRTKDMVDKFIQYRKINSLKYYLLVEPQKLLVLCKSKNKDGDWDTASYTKADEIIQLPVLNIELPLEKIYNS